MRIAQVAPLYESCPPQLYGGTERVVSYLTEELVRQGHEVTLFASGDSRTKATLQAPCERALAPRSSVQGPASPSLDLAVSRGAKRRCIRHHPFPHRLSPLSAVRAALGQDADDAARPPRPAGPSAALSRVRDDAAGVDLECAARARCPGPTGTARFITVCRRAFMLRGRGDGGYLAFIGRICPEKRPDWAIEIAHRAGLPLTIAAKVDKVDRDLLQDQDQATAQGSGDRLHRRDQRQRKRSILGRCGGPACFRSIGRSRSVWC